MKPTVLTTSSFPKTLFVTSMLAATIFATTTLSSTNYAVSGTPFVPSSTPSDYAAGLTDDTSTYVFTDDSETYYLTWG